MANGFDYESPINRLLSVTIPQFLEGQLDRQESARRFDEQQAFRQQQFDAQIEQQARENDIMDKALKTEELDRANAERLEIENSMLSSIQLEPDSENALRLGENFDFTTVQGKSKYRVLRKRIELGKENNSNILNSYRQILPSEVIDDLESSSSWNSPITHSDVKDRLGIYISTEKFADTKFNNKVTILSKNLESIEKRLKPVNDMLSKMAVSPDSKKSPEYLSLLQQANTYQDQLNKGYLELSNFLSQESGLEIKTYEPPSGVLAAYPKRNLTVGVDVTIDEVSKLPPGTSINMGGATVQVTETGEFKAVDSSDAATFSKALEENLSEIYVDDIPSAIETVTPEPLTEVGVDDAGAVERLAERTYEGGKEPMSRGFEDILRASPSQQREMGTGEGGMITFGGAPESNIKALRSAEKGISQTIDNLMASRAEWQTSFPSTQQETESVNSNYLQNIDKSNKELGFLLRNTYQAYFNETNPRIKARLKKSLDRAVSRVESENSKFQKMKQYKGRYKRWERTAQSVPLISNETIAIANAIKTATKLPSSAQDILDTNKVSDVELEQQIQQDFKISPQEFEREIEQEFNALPDDVRLGVYNNDINNYRTAMLNRIKNAAVYGKAPQGAVEQLLNSLQ
jgi:hypothetical protein